MIAVIAGIVALDPLGAAQTNINTCQLSGPLSCNGDTVLLSAGDDDLQFELENSGRSTLTITTMNISNQGGGSAANWNRSSDLQIQPGEVETIVFPNGTGNVSKVFSGSIVESEQYTFPLELSYFTTRAGSTYERPAEGQIRTVAAN
jgi:hypothetical protein